MQTLDLARHRGDHERDALADALAGIIVCGGAGEKELCATTLRVERRIRRSQLPG